MNIAKRKFCIGIIALAPLVSFVFIARADDKVASPNPPTGFQIQQMDPNFSVDAMKGPGVHLHPAYELNSTLPPVETRDKLLSQAGLDQEIKSWDQLDKDLLYVKAKSATKGDLKRRYPKLNPEKLVEFQKLVKRSIGR